MHIGRSVDIFLRLGVAFAFLFPAINAVFDPYSWLGYLPGVLRDLAPELVLLHVFGFIEVVIAVWILSGRRIFFPTVFACVILVLIILLNIGDFQVLFRDVSILFMALALAVLHRPRSSSALPS